MKNLLGLGLMLLLAVSAAAQRPSDHTVQPKSAAASPLPVYEFSLSEAADYPTIPWPKNDPSIETPVETRCNGDGNVFIWKPARGLIGLTAKGIVLFSADMITDMPHPSVTFVGADLAVSDAGVFFTAGSYEDKDAEPSTSYTDNRGAIQTQKGMVSRSRQFVAHFDKDGHYDGAIKDFPFIVYRLASFNSGNFVAAGMDEGRRARFALLNSQGQPLAYLELPKDITANSEPTPVRGSKPCDGCGSNSAGALLPAGDFTPARGRILFFRHGMDSLRTYEIQQSGEVRVVNFKLPKGFRMRGFIPSDTNWIAYAAQTDPPAARSLFEIDPANGQLLIEYRLPDQETYPACFAAGELWAVRRDNKEAQLRVVHGSATPLGARP